jgi:hypothetical protein
MELLMTYLAFSIVLCIHSNLSTRNIGGKTISWLVDKEGKEWETNFELPNVVE